MCLLKRFDCCSKACTVFTLPVLGLLCTSNNVTTHRRVVSDRLWTNLCLPWKQRATITTCWQPKQSQDHKILGLPFCIQLLTLSENVGNWSGNTDFTLVTTDFRGAAVWFLDQCDWDLIKLKWKPPDLKNDSIVVKKLQIFGCSIGISCKSKSISKDSWVKMPGFKAEIYLAWNLWSL